jgi:hypothetical protein
MERQLQSTMDLERDACEAAIFLAVFRLISISDLYGSVRAVEWAESLLDDPKLLAAFAHPQRRRIAA